MQFMARRHVRVVRVDSILEELPFGLEVVADVHGHGREEHLRARLSGGLGPEHAAVGRRDVVDRVAQRVLRP